MLAVLGSPSSREEDQWAPFRWNTPHSSRTAPSTTVCTVWPGGTLPTLLTLRTAPSSGWYLRVGVCLLPPSYPSLAFYWHQWFLSQGAYLGVIVIDYPGSCMGSPHPPVYKQTTPAAPSVCLMTTQKEIAVAQAAQNLPALHRLSTQLDIGESTLPPNPYISFKHFDKYSHNATKLVIMHRKQTWT